MGNMTAKELQVWLKANFPTENHQHEWKEWASLKSNISGRKGEDLVSYVSALANMDGGCIVIGVQDKTLAVTGIQDFADYTPENIVNRILGKTPGLPSLGLHIEALQASDTGATVWLVHVPRHAPRQPVQAHDKAWQRDGDSLVALRADRQDAILREPLAGQDWSAGLVADATLADLDIQALQLARKQFTAKNSQERWAGDIAEWSDSEFLDRAKLSASGLLTRTALLLLGKSESTHKLQHPAEMVWRLLEERAVKAFHPPYLLTSSELLRQVRNDNIKLFPATSLIPVEVPKYEIRVVLEALHNCIAHQDYECVERIVVDETSNQLRFQSGGSFFDGEATEYALTGKVPTRYRNPWLVNAMRSIGMIDSAGFGIKEMFEHQRRRFLPLPEYQKSTDRQVVLTIYGQAIDENYSRLLMERSELPLEQVLWLDRVQKKHRIADDQAAVLRKAKLIEGRKPNFFVSAHIADATDTRTEYTRNKGLDDRYYKTFVLQHIQKFKSVPASEVRALLLDKLPNSLTEQQKLAKVKNLLTALRIKGMNGQKIVATSPGKGAKWSVLKQ